MILKVTVSIKLNETSCQYTVIFTTKISPNSSIDLGPGKSAIAGPGRTLVQLSNYLLEKRCFLPFEVSGKFDNTRHMLLIGENAIKTFLQP